MSWTEEQIQEAVTTVMQKAGTDTKYRKLVLSDVHAAVKEATGKEVPKEFKINVIDGTGYHANIVLPEMRGTTDELTETELDAVAGGSKENPIFPSGPFRTIPTNPIDPHGLEEKIRRLKNNS